MKKIITIISLSAILASCSSDCSNNCNETSKNDTLVVDTTNGTEIDSVKEK